jgi:hypothetical protein
MQSLASLINGRSLMDTDFPLKEKSRFSGMLRLEKIMMSVLSGLNDIALYPGGKKNNLIQSCCHIT